MLYRSEKRTLCKQLDRRLNGTIHLPTNERPKSLMEAPLNLSICFFYWSGKIEELSLLAIVAKLKMRLTLHFSFGTLSLHKDIKKENLGTATMDQEVWRNHVYSTVSVVVKQRYLACIYPPNLAPPSLWTRVCHVIVPILDSFVPITTGTSLIHPCQQLN